MPAGVAIVDRFINVISTRQEALLAGFTEQEKRLLLDLLQRVVMLMLADEEQTDAICLQCWSRRGDDCILRDLPGGCLHNRNH